MTLALRRSLRASLFCLLVVVGCRDPSVPVNELGEPCREGACLDDDRACSGPVALELDHLVTDDTRESAIEIAVRAVVPTLPRHVAPACGLTATCDAPVVACEGTAASEGVSSEVTATCTDGALVTVDVESEERSARVHVTETATAVIFEELRFGSLWNRVVRTFDLAGARAKDVRHVQPDSDFATQIEHTFVVGVVVRRDRFTPCTDGSVGTCLVAVVHYGHTDDVAFESVGRDLDIDGDVDVEWVLTYDDPSAADRAIVSVIEHRTGESIDEVLVAECCVDDDTCADYHPLDLAVFQSTRQSAR